MPEQLRLFAEGLASTGLAAVQVAGWVALGGPAARRLPRTEHAVAVALLAGAAVTACIYALVTWAGHVTTAIVIGAALSIAALGAQRRWVKGELSTLATAYRDALAGSRALLTAAAIFGLMMWLLAIAPPRDADVLHYHLAHVRQIVQDGGWKSIPDYDYGIPFGWSLNFLPFERIGLPQVANLLSLALTLVTVAVLLRLGRKLGSRRVAVGVVALLVLIQPWMLKADTTAHADAYIVLVCATLVALLIDAGARTNAALVATGFVAVVGLQSRYQAAALLVAAAVVLLVELLRRRLPPSGLLPLSAGALAAGALASPFYIRNALFFGNPFWPLQIDRFGGNGYADRVANRYETGLDGRLTTATVVRSLRAFVHDTTVFPIPLALGLSVAAILVVPSLRRRIWRPAAFLLAFMAIWIVAQPNLNFRFVLIVVPAVVVATIAAADAPLRRIPLRAYVAVVVVVLAPFAAFDAYYASDTARFALTGDLAVYHRYTWYYPVYRWIDHDAPEAARGLAIVRGGQSYYLDRRYRRADPALSGVVDWERVDSGRKLARVLQRGGYDFVVYDEDPDWPGNMGGPQMIRAIGQAREEGVLRRVRTFHVKLYESRIRRTANPAVVDVFAVRGAHHPLH